MLFDKRSVVVKSSIESQFNYFPLTWMFHSRQLNSKINCLHGFAPTTYKSLFCELLENE